MSELHDALKDVDDLADGSEPDTFWVIVEAARRVVSLDNQGLHRETETTCRTCRDEPDAAVHDWDTYESSERWVTDWQELPDPALGITPGDTG